MNKKFLLIAGLLLVGIQLNSQTPSKSNTVTIQPVADRMLIFKTSDQGVETPILWGLDTAWPDEGNIRRGIAFMGKDNIDIVRASFQPVRELIDGKFQDGDFVWDSQTYKSQKFWLDRRLELIGLTGPNTKVALNSDHPFVHPWFSPSDPATYAERWAQLLELTTRYIQDKGRTVVSVAPFNEPDYGWQQGTQQNFYDIAAKLKSNAYFNNIRISGGNTLSSDQALPWYDFLKDNLDEGNTHQLAGSFDGYANFFKAVRANGHYATADELHNVMEAMVGVEYGMQTGIWWGTAELARGEFVKATSNGKRLAYAEHRPKWTAASVYKTLDGRIQAFGGTSERQASTSTYRFVSKDKDVYFDGYGPQREYTMVLPGGNGYMNGQTNAERVVNVTWGEDIQPVINGRYVLVNRNSGKVMEVANGYTQNGAYVRQYNYDKDALYQQWSVFPVDSRIGGDFSYFTLKARHSSTPIEVQNHSLDDGAGIQIWEASNNANQQWYFEYAGDGWFYIRSRLSAKCLQVVKGSTTSGAAIQQSEKTGDTHQQWRLIPVGAPIELDAPSSPSQLKATVNAASVRLDWQASPEADVTGYTILRADQIGGEYNTIARNVELTSFTDNTALDGQQYFYKVRAMDKSLNRSDYSNEATATTTGDKDMISHFAFDDNTQDTTVQLNHAALGGDASYVTGKTGNALSLNGTNTFLQLPANVANHDGISIATWIYWEGGNAWQRIFDFGNGENEYMFLTANAYNRALRFAIKNGGEETKLDVDKLPVNTWTHVTVTLSKSTGVSIYVNGILGNQLNEVEISPNDFKPVLNYIGRSQYPVDPLFNGYIDDFKVYNYALSANEVANVMDNGSGVTTTKADKDQLMVWPIPANDVLNIKCSAKDRNNKCTVFVYNMNGEALKNTIMEEADANIDISELPNGVYILKLEGQDKPVMGKFVVHH